MNISNFKSVISKIKSLPTLPQVFYKIIETIEMPDSSAKDVKETIKKDPSISAKILKISNSALYGYTKEITDISKAIVLLGFDMIKSIALSVSVFSSFPRTENYSTKFDRELFWIHSMASAEAAVITADKMGYPKKDQAFLIGLIHDIGKVVLDYYFTPEYKRVIAKVRQENLLIREAEIEILNFDHALIGGWLGEQWHFPESILNSIKYHHRVNEAPKEVIEEVIIGHIADIVARSAKIGSGGDYNIPKISNIVFKKTELTQEAFDQIIQQLADKKTEIEEFFKLLS
ncbi:HDOD domain-containing protein [candidate division KSB1 bacterium]